MQEPIREVSVTVAVYEDGRWVWDLRCADGRVRAHISDELGPLSNLDEILRIVCEEACEQLQHAIDTISDPGSLPTSARRIAQSGTDPSFVSLF